MLLKESLDSQRLLFRKLLSLGKPVGYSLRSGTNLPGHFGQPTKFLIAPGSFRSFGPEESTRFFLSCVLPTTGDFVQAIGRQIDYNT